MKKTLSLLVALSLLLGICCGATSVAAAEEPVTLTMFVDAPWWPYTDWSGIMPKWAEEQTGIKFDVTIAASYDELAMKVASGDLPDIVISENFALMANEDICYDWDTLIEQHDLDWQLHPAYKYVNQSGDGKTYTVMVGWSADYEYEQYPDVPMEGRGCCMREDIATAAMQELGIEKVTTIEDLENILAICKRDYPDVLPYAYCGDWNMDYFMMAMYGCSESGFIDEGDGQVKLWLNQPSRKDMFLKLNEWARKGYISKETVGWSNISTGGEWAQAGNLFTYAFSQGTAESLDISCEKNNVDYRWIQLTDIKPDGSAYYQYRAGWRGYFITKNCKNTEAAIKYAKFAVDKPTQYSMMWGIEGKDWNWNEDKTKAILNYDTAIDTDFVAEMQLRWGWLGHDGISNNMYNANKTGKGYEGGMWMKDLTVWQPISGILWHMMEPDSDESIAYNELIQLEKDSFVNIVFADTAEEAEAKYNEMISIGESLGSKDLEAWANERYPELLEGYNQVKDIGAEGWIRNK